MYMLIFQVVKLMGFEKGKKNKINMNFLVGNRVLNKIEKLYKNELSLNLLLRLDLTYLFIYLLKY